MRCDEMFLCDDLANFIFEFLRLYYIEQTKLSGH